MSNSNKNPNTNSRNTNKVGNQSATSNKGNKQTILSSLVSTSLKDKAATGKANKVGQYQTAQSSLEDHPTSTNPETTETKSSTMTDETKNPTEHTMVEEDNEAIQQEEPVEVRTMDVVVAGATYPVNCPVDEKEDLDKAVLYINHFIRDIRKNAPALNHENILVLCCLNMYEEMKQHRNTQASLRYQDKQIQELLGKVMEDAKSILTDK